MTKQKLKLPIIALIIANVLWGINVPVIKLGLETIPVIVFMGVRFMLASLFFLPFAIKTWKPLKPKYLWMMILSSMIWIPVTALSLNIGLKYAPSINVGVIDLLGPLILCLLSVEFLKERMSFKAFAGIMVAFAGAAIIIGKPWEVAINGDKVLLGNILFLTSMLAGVVSAVIAKPVLNKMSSFQAAFMYVFPGTLPIIPFTIMELGNWSFRGLPSSAYFSIVYSISAVTIANLLFMYGLKYKKVHSVGIFQYLQPIAIFITAWFLLDERPTTRYVAGAFLVVLGIYLGEFHLPPRPKLKRKNYLRRLQIKFLQNGL